MFSFRRFDQQSKSLKPGLVSPVEVQHEFDSQTVFLHWLAEVITGDAQLAERCVTDARSLASKHSGTFVDWLAQWARVATIHCAIEQSHKPILAAASAYKDFRCSHGGHRPISLEEMLVIQAAPIHEIITELDPFVRTVMVLRAIPHCAIQDCALQLRTTRLAVCAGCCVAAQWLQTRSSVLVMDDSPIAMSNSHCQPEHAWRDAEWQS